MKQEKAFERIRDLFPDEAQYISIKRDRTMRPNGKTENEFWIFNHIKGRETVVMAHSNRSWEHALAIAKSGNPDCWPEDDSPIEEAALEG